MSSPAAPSFSISSLQAHCDQGAWSRGMGLFRQSAVVRIDVEEEGKGVWRIGGEVQGTQPEPYTLSVELVLAPNGQVRSW
ncbi:MAG: hypothetical protein IV087_17445, partial [Acidovorax sp.]|nr:hypothetical protein [Acidovorax sp.]